MKSLARLLFCGFGLLVCAAVAAGPRLSAQSAVGQVKAPSAPDATSRDDQVWKEFQEFGKGQDGPAVVAAYRAKLLADGMTEQQSWDRVFLIDRLRQERRRDAFVSHFNRLYTAPQDVFTTQPNAFLVSVVRDLKPGTALDVAMGQGRNTVYLATRGWEATGFDPAEEGLKVARDEAARAGVRINAIKSTYEEFDFGKNRWDLIVFCYAFAPLSDAALVRRVHESLRPGGLVLVEHPMNEPRTAMHPQDRVNALPNAFGNKLRILFYEDTTGISEWQQSATKRADDPRRMVRLLARKEADR